MTAALVLAPEATSLAEGAHEIEALLDRMQASSALLAPDSCAAVVGDLERILRRVEALKLRLIARPEAAEAASGAGFSDTGSWLSRQTRTSRGEAARQTRLASQLVAAPQTGFALASGDLSAAHAAVVTAALDRLPARVTPDQRAQVEGELVAKAQRFDPEQLRRIARRAIETIEPDAAVVDAAEDDQVHEEEAAAHERVRLTFHDNDDGTVTGHFTTTALAAAMLRKMIDAMTAPRRSRAGSGESLPVDWAVRRGAAFTEVLEHLPTDHLHSRVAATVVVQLRHDVLLGALAASHLDTGDQISAGEARRLACGAGIVPTVLGGGSLPLDVGREHRLFTEAQRTALSTRHTTCAAEGCERPFAWCELHHAKPWSQGGRTDLDQAVPLCAFHHRRVHDPGFRHRDGPDGLRFERAGPELVFGG